MKKTLIAIAALAATGAFAQSSVTISGSFEAGIVNHNMKGHKVVGFSHNMSSTSGLNFLGTTDLGGGLKANFKLGTDINPVSREGNTGSTAGTVGRFGGAESFLNLQGGFGKAAIGSPNGLGLGIHATSQPFGTAIGSGFRVTSPIGGSVRYDNSMRYDSPSFGGVTISYLGRKQQTDAPSTTYTESFGAQDQAKISEFGASYNAGPLNVAFASTTEDALNAAGAKTTLTGLAANYTFGNATVYGGYQLLKSVNALNAGQADTKAFNLAGKYVMGTSTILANYGRRNGYIGAVNYGTNNSANLLGLGYEYALSKTAAVTVRYERHGDNAVLNAVPTTGYTTVAGDTTRTRMGVGLRLAF